MTITRKKYMFRHLLAIVRLSSSKLMVLLYIYIYIYSCYTHTHTHTHTHIYIYIYIYIYSAYRVSSQNTPPHFQYRSYMLCKTSGCIDLSITCAPNTGGAKNCIHILRDIIYVLLFEVELNCGGNV